MAELKIGDHYVVIEITNRNTYVVKRNNIPYTRYKTPEAWQKHCEILAVNVASNELVWAYGYGVGFDETPSHFTDYDKALAMASAIVKTSRELSEEQNSNALKLKNEGHTYRQIAALLHVTADRATKMVNQGRAYHARFMNQASVTECDTAKFQIEIQKAKAFLEQHGYNVIPKPQ